VVDVWAVVEEARVHEWAGGRVGATVVDGTEVVVGATVVDGTEVVVGATVVDGTEVVVGATVVDGTEVVIGATVVGGTEVVVTAAAGSVVASDSRVDVRHTAATSCRLRSPPDRVVGMAGKTKCGFRSEIAPDDTTSDPPMPPTSIAAIAIATAIPPPIPSRRALRCSGLRW
jgi:NDP-sugar pyrophosphorylase family protein